MNDESLIFFFFTKPDAFKNFTSQAHQGWKSLEGVFLRLFISTYWCSNKAIKNPLEPAKPEG